MSPFKIFPTFERSQLVSSEIDQKARECVLGPQRAALRCVLAIILGSGLLAHAVDDSVSRQGTDVSAIENPGVAIEVDGRLILFVYPAVGGYSPQERAEHIQQRIVDEAKRADIPIELIRANERGSWTEILAGNDLIMGVTECDAKAIGRERSRLTAEYVEIIRQVIKQYRAEHTRRELLRRVISTLVATVALASSLLILFGVRTFGRASVGKRLARHETEVQSVGQRLKGYGGRQLLTISRIAFWIAVVALLQTYGTVVLRFFPATRHTSYQITNWLFSELGGSGKSVIAYLPNLVLVVIICAGAYYLIQVNQHLFAEIRDQRLAIRGFYSDWDNARWRTVHQLLIAAALSTDGILYDLPPFVLQSALNDFYVAYELNAFTDQLLRMQYVYSELHRNIQDKFNEAGVEINSPHYAALRDGSRRPYRTTIWLVTTKTSIRDSGGPPSRAGP